MGTQSGIIKGLQYRGGVGYLSFIGHRLAGLGTLLFLTVHIFDTATVYFFPNLYADAINIYRSTPLMIGEIVLVAAVIYHGLNGLLITLNDLFPRRWGRTNEPGMFWRVAVITTLLWAPAAFLMGRNLYWNNICHCAPITTVDDRAVSDFALVSIPLAFIVIIAVLTIGIYPSRRTMSPPDNLPPERNIETWSWLFMRLSGPLLIPLVWIHVLILDVLTGVGKIDIDLVALRWATLGWRIFDIALLAFAFAHGMNGLRHVVDDYIKHPGWKRTLHWIMLLGWAVITAIGAIAVVGGVQ